MSRRDDVFKSFDLYKDETDDRVKSGIEQNRKGFFQVNVKSPDGTPVTDVKLKFVQKKHEFLHGANLFMLEELETPEKNERYRRDFAKIFNQATLPFYWSDLEPTEGNIRFSKDSEKIYRRPTPDLCLEYCEENGIYPKAHCLTYFNFQPEWVNKEDIAENKSKLVTRYEKIAERYKDRIKDWEVVNELLCSWDTSARYAFYKEDNVTEWNFELAKKYFPANKLIINEATNHVWSWGAFMWNRSPYYQMIERALKSGSPIDCIGMQFHSFDSRNAEKELYRFRYNPMRMFEVMDQYAKLNLPMQITEITIPAYSNSAEDEAVQAELIEKLYSIWFSHQSMEAIIYWNLVDGYAAFAPMGDMTAGENIYHGGLLRFDMSKKPAYDMMDELFNRRWVTNTEATSGENGEAKFKGFYGDYEIVAEKNGTKKVFSASFLKNCQNKIELNW